MGIIHDDFEYKIVSIFLNLLSKQNKHLSSRTLKTFIKNVACFPHKNTKIDVDLIRLNFSFQEILFLIFYISMVKMRIELTFLTLKLNENNKYEDSR